MAKRVMPYRKHHHRDWMTSATVMAMSYAARGIYLALLDIQWETQWVFEDAEMVRKMLRATPEEWADFAPFLDICFPICPDGKRRNPRLEEERLGADAQVQRNRENGGKGGRPKTQTKPKRNPVGNPSETQTKPNTEAEADKEKREKKKVPTVDECVFYGASIGLPKAEAEHFFDYQTSSGWMVGTKPMKDWQAAMRTWKRKWSERRPDQRKEWS